MIEKSLSETIKISILQVLVNIVMHIHAKYQKDRMKTENMKILPAQDELTIFIPLAICSMWQQPQVTLLLFMGWMTNWKQENLDKIFLEI